MRPMANELTARDACLIIKAAQDAGARKLSFRGLELEFGVTAPAWPEPEAYPKAPPEATASASTKESVLERDELAAKEDRVAEMVIDDPVEMERLLALGELKDATDGADHEEA